jgi:hypothetical protein
MPYIKQANIANGPQQVNNGTATHAADSKTQQNQLLEDSHGGTYLDTQRWQGPPSRGNKRHAGEDCIGIFRVSACLPSWCWQTDDVSQRTDTLFKGAYLRDVV